MAVKQLSSDVINSEVENKPAKGNRVVWDNGRTGLGVRITAKGHVSFVYRYVIAGRERRFTLGDYGPAPKLTVSAAREIVRKRDFRKDGKKLNPEDPLGDVEADRAAKTMNELCDRYLTDYAEARKRPSSIRMDKINI